MKFYITCPKEGDTSKRYCNSENRFEINLSIPNESTTKKILSLSNFINNVGFLSSQCGDKFALVYQTSQIIGQESYSAALYLILDKKEYENIDHKKYRFIDRITIPTWLSQNSVTNDDIELAKEIKRYYEDWWSSPSFDRSIFNSTELKENERKLIACIVDDILKMKGNDADVKQIGIIDSSKNKDLSAMQRILTLALECLPYRIANQVSFNTSASRNVGDCNIFCTLLQKEAFEGIKLYDINKEYNLKNDACAFARHILVCNEDPCKGYEDVQSVDELNIIFELADIKDNLDKIYSEISKHGDIDALKISEYRNKYNDLIKKNVSRDQNIEELFKKITYSIYFDYSNWCKYNADAGEFEDYSEFLSSKDKFDKVTKTFIIETAEAFKKCNSEDNEHQGYIKFLSACEDEEKHISTSLKKAIFAFLHKNISDNDLNNSMQQAITSYLLNQLSDEIDYKLLDAYKYENNSILQQDFFRYSLCEHYSNKEDVKFKVDLFKKLEEKDKNISSDSKYEMIRILFERAEFSIKDVECLLDLYQNNKSENTRKLLREKISDIIKNLNGDESFKEYKKLIQAIFIELSQDIGAIKPLFIQLCEKLKDKDLAFKLNVCKYVCEVCEDKDHKINVATIFEAKSSNKNVIHVLFGKDKFYSKENISRLNDIYNLCPTSDAVNKLVGDKLSDTINNIGECEYSQELYDIIMGFNFDLIKSNNDLFEKLESWRGKEEYKKIDEFMINRKSQHDSFLELNLKKHKNSKNKLDPREAWVKQCLKERHYGKNDSIKYIVLTFIIDVVLVLSFFGVFYGITKMESILITKFLIVGATSCIRIISLIILILLALISLCFACWHAVKAKQISSIKDVFKFSGRYAVAGALVSIVHIVVFLLIMLVFWVI